jgi:hypothetical protein
MAAEADREAVQRRHGLDPGQRILYIVSPDRRLSVRNQAFSVESGESSGPSEAIAWREMLALPHQAGSSGRRRSSPALRAGSRAWRAGRTLPSLPIGRRWRKPGGRPPMIWVSCAARRSSGARDARRRDFTIGAAEGVLRIAELPPALWPLLVIGSETHIGKGASEGFGRYLLA